MSILCHAQTLLKYILQVSDAELIVACNTCMLHIVSYTMRDGIKNLYCLYFGDIFNVHVYCHSSQGDYRGATRVS